MIEFNLTDDLPALQRGKRCFQQRILYPALIVQTDLAVIGEDDLEVDNALVYRLGGDNCARQRKSLPVAEKVCNNPVVTGSQVAPPSGERK